LEQGFIERRYPMDRQFAPQTYLDLKARFRDLVRAAGGPKRVAEKTRGCQSRISEAMAPQVDDRFPAVDQVADLEADTVNSLRATVETAAKVVRS
jgi:hypothetical protein